MRQSISASTRIWALACAATMVLGAVLAYHVNHAFASVNFHTIGGAVMLIGLAGALLVFGEEALGRAGAGQSRNFFTSRVG